MSIFNRSTKIVKSEAKAYKGNLAMRTKWSDKSSVQEVLFSNNFCDPSEIPEEVRPLIDKWVEKQDISIHRAIKLYMMEEVEIDGDDKIKISREVWGILFSYNYCKEEAHIRLADLSSERSVNLQNAIFDCHKEVGMFTKKWITNLSDLVQYLNNCYVRNDAVTNDQINRFRDKLQENLREVLRDIKKTEKASSAAKKEQRKHDAKSKVGSLDSDGGAAKQVAVVAQADEPKTADLFDTASFPASAEGKSDGYQNLVDNIVEQVIGAIEQRVISNDVLDEIAKRVGDSLVNLKTTSVVEQGEPEKQPDPVVEPVKKPESNQGKPAVNLPGHRRNNKAKPGTQQEKPVTETPEEQLGKQLQSLDLDK